MLEFIKNRIFAIILLPEAFEEKLNWGWYMFYCIFYGVLAYIMLGIASLIWFDYELPTFSSEPSAWK